MEIIATMNIEKKWNQEIKNLILQEVQREAPGIEFLSTLHTCNFAAAQFMFQNSLCCGWQLAANNPAESLLQSIKLYSYRSGRKRTHQTFKLLDKGREQDLFDSEQKVFSLKQEISIFSHSKTNNINCLFPIVVSPNSLLRSCYETC